MFVVFSREKDGVILVLHKGQRSFPPRNSILLAASNLYTYRKVRTSFVIAMLPLCRSNLASTRAQVGRQTCRALDHHDFVVQPYSVEIPDHLVESEEAFIVAAQRLAIRDELGVN